MIRLTRVPVPPELATWLADRGAQLIAALISGDIPAVLRNAYRYPPLKALLLSDTLEKCAYCESHVTHVYFADVEHIAPKALRPELLISRDNLTIACAVCNNAKGDYYDENVPLINPFVDDPDEHLTFFGPVVIPRPLSDRGLMTVERLQLNRPPLVMQRVAHLRRLEPLVREYARSAEPIKSLLHRQLIREATAESEYAAMTRKYLDEVGIDQATN